MLRLPCLSASPPSSCWAERTTLELNMILEHNTLNMMRPDGHLQAEESTTALSDGADFERLEDKDQPTGLADTELNGRLYSSQVSTLDPEKSFSAQGISKGATLSLLPRIIIGGVGGSPEDEKQETQRDSTSTVGGESISIKAIQIASAQATSHGSSAPSPTSALTHAHAHVYPHPRPNPHTSIPPWGRSWHRDGPAGGGRFATHQAFSFK